MLRPIIARLFGASALALVFCAAPAIAGVYKCKDKNGDVIYSNTPCEQQGAQKQKELSKADLQSNQMRMRARPDQGGAASFEQGQDSNYKGAAPNKAPGAPAPKPAGAAGPRDQQS